MHTRKPSFFLLMTLTYGGGETFIAMYFMFEKGHERDFERKIFSRYCSRTTGCTPRVSWQSSGHKYLITLTCTLSDCETSNEDLNHWDWDLSDVPSASTRSKSPIPRGLLSSRKTECSLASFAKILCP